MTKIFLRVLIFTVENLEKISPIINSLTNIKNNNIEIVLVFNKLIESTFSDPRVRLIFIEEPSVHHLRKEVANLSIGSEWILVLEDHNLVSEGYLEKYLMTLSGVTHDINYVCGSALNLTSRDSWSWANFMFVLAKHWQPVAGNPNEPVIFNAAYRSSIFRPGSLRIGQFESELLPIFFANSIFFDDLIVDHKQFRRFPKIFFYFFAHGKATSGTYSDDVILRVKWTWRHLLRLFKVRFIETCSIIRSHPRRSELPPFTLTRLFFLYLFHAMGGIFGAIFGAGSAVNYLE